MSGIITTPWVTPEPWVPPPFPLCDVLVRSMGKRLSEISREPDGPLAGRRRSQADPTRHDIPYSIHTHSYFKSYFHNPTKYEIGTMVAILEIGAFMTSLAAGRIGDIFGRRRTLFWGAAIFCLGGAVQTCATGFEVMVFGRIVSGFGVGFLS